MRHKKSRTRKSYDWSTTSNPNNWLQGDVPAWIVHHHRLLGSLLLPVGRLPVDLPRHRPEEPLVLPLWSSSGLDDCLRHSLNVISHKVFSQTLVQPIKTSRSKRKQRKNLSLTSLRATLKKWSCNCKRRLKMRIEGKPGNFEQRKTVHCPFYYWNYILQMNAFLSLNCLPLKLAQSCSAMPRVVRSLSTSEEGNCREMVSFPHPPSLLPPSLLITSQKSFVRSRA